MRTRTLACAFSRVRERAVRTYELYVHALCWAFQEHKLSPSLALFCSLSISRSSLPLRCLLAEVTVGRHCFTQRYSSKEEEEEEEEGSFKEEESLFKADAEGWG